ncbi:MAG: hypothetical protein ABGY95_03040 [Rubritalea sp.]
MTPFLGNTHAHLYTAILIPNHPQQKAFQPNRNPKQPRPASSPTVL